MITVYGIANCDMIKKTMAWYKSKNIAVNFHDCKTHGIDRHILLRWCGQVGWDVLLNKKSTAWRSLPAIEQQKAINEKVAVQLMMKNTSIIKRPVIEMEDKIIVGFDKVYFTKQ